MTALALVLVGIALAVAGVRVALERPRPLNLAGMILAPVGLGVALLGAGRWLSPSFFTGKAPAASERALPLRVMPAGDAVTRGSHRAGEGGYRTPLWSRLTHAGHAVDFVGAERSGPFAIDRDHESWDDVTIDGLAARLLRDIPAYRPQVILLCVGANDLAAGATPEGVAGRVGSLVDALVASAPQVELLVGPLVSVSGPRSVELVEATNVLLRALANERAVRGARVRFVEMHAQIPPPGLDSLTGNAPPDPGFAAMAEAWAKALEPSFAREPRRK